MVELEFKELKNLHGYTISVTRQRGRTLSQQTF